MTSARKQLIVVGNGMVGHRFIELLQARERASDFQITVLAEEPRAAYDRVNLSKFFEGEDGEALALASR